MKSLFLKYAVPLLQKFLPSSREQKRILVVSTTALGDTLWGTPAIESLRKSFPESYIAVLTSSIGLEVFAGNPYIDKLYQYRFSLWRELRKERFDTVLVFHTSLRLVLPLCALIGAKRIVGTVGINKGLDALLTHPQPPLHQHEIVRRLKIVEAIGAKIHTEKLSFFPNEIAPQRSEKLTIALHPGSKDRFKRWPFFPELGRLLKERLDCEILITGTEKKLMQELAEQIPGAKIQLAGSLHNLAAQLKNVDLLISNDTGPVHLACALNVPLVAIYASTDVTLCGPHKADKAVAISRRRACTPCLKRKCRTPFCFLQIGVDEVAEKAEELCTKKRPALLSCS